MITHSTYPSFANRSHSLLISVTFQIDIIQSKLQQYDKNPCTNINKLCILDFNEAYHIYGDILYIYRTYTPIIQNGWYATCSRNKDGGRMQIFSLGKPMARRTT